jgi:hypothetical protein
VTAYLQKPAFESNRKKRGNRDMATQATPIGFNRTGISSSPDAAHDMVEGTTEFAPDEFGDEQNIGLVRQAFAKQAGPLGSLPPPESLKGLATVAIEGLKGAHPTQFIDKLGERLAFERTGVRLYEAVISKYGAFGSFEGGPEQSELEEMMMDEHEHFRLLSNVVKNIGGDPTVITPSADLQATMSKGIAEVMVDARTTFVQCLDALLVAELADNEGWEGLIAMARQNSQDGIIPSFERAAQDETRHLKNVRRWITAAQNRPNVG